MSSWYRHQAISSNYQFFFFAPASWQLIDEFTVVLNLPYYDTHRKKPSCSGINLSFKLRWRLSFDFQKQTTYSSLGMAGTTLTFSYLKHRQIRRIHGLKLKNTPLFNSTSSSLVKHHMHLCHITNSTISRNALTPISPLSIYNKQSNDCRISSIHTESGQYS